MPVYVKPSLSSVNANLDVFTRPALNAVNFDLGIKYISAFISPQLSTAAATVFLSRNLSTSIAPVIGNADDAEFTICIYIEDIVVQVAINRVQFSAAIAAVLSIGQPILKITSANCSIVWGQQTGVVEAIEDFSSNWTGTGDIVNTGDGEEIELEDGEYLECAPVNTSVRRIELLLDEYEPGYYGDIILKYRTGATSVLCIAETYAEYAEPFDSEGFVQLRVEG